jgi:hypothetical protein
LTTCGSENSLFLLQSGPRGAEFESSDLYFLDGFEVLTAVTAKSEREIVIDRVAAS